MLLNPKGTNEFRNKSESSSTTLISFEFSLGFCAAFPLCTQACWGCDAGVMEVF